MAAAELEGDVVHAVAHAQAGGGGGELGLDAGMLFVWLVCSGERGVQGCDHHSKRKKSPLKKNNKIQ